MPLQSVLLRHSGQDQDHLHHSKPIADADARPTPERDVSEPWELPGEVAAPTLGTKLRRVLERSGRPPAKLGIAFRMGRGRIFLLDRHAMNLNFRWKDGPFAASWTSPLVWQATWPTICFRVCRRAGLSQGALVSRQGTRERGRETSGGRGVGTCSCWPSLQAGPGGRIERGVDGGDHRVIGGRAGETGGDLSAGNDRALRPAETPPRAAAARAACQRARGRRCGHVVFPPLA